MPTREDGHGHRRLSQQEIPCWFCEGVFTSRQVMRDGILRSRGPAEGGPYRLYICPDCGRENLCERTQLGRWFASPNYKLSFLDHLLSSFLDAGSTEAATLLAAIHWFRENEERRRYFFERDGDRRYSGRRILSRWWSRGHEAEEPDARPRPRPRPARAREREEEADEPEDEARRTRGGGAAAEPRRAMHVESPYDVLGLRANASEAQVREAFHRLAIHYHPDKVRHLGEDFERVAHEKFLRLKEAYETLLRLKTARREG